MLGRLEMDIDECILMYSEFSSSIFRGESSRLPVSWKSRTRAQFDSANLGSTITRVITTHCKSESDLFNNHVEPGCRVWVES